MVVNLQPFVTEIRKGYGHGGPFFSVLCARKRAKNFATTHTLLGHAHQINSSKSTKKCVPSGRTGDVLVAKSVILEFERSNTISAEP